MVDIPVLSPADIQFLRELRRAHERTNQSRQTLERNRSPEASKSSYLVEVPEGESIPAKTTSIVDSLTCYVVRLDRSNNTLVRTGQTLLVHNSTETEIEAGYVFVNRDAFGTWWVGDLGTGTGVDIVRFTITGAVLDGALGVRSAYCSIDEVVCGGSEWSSFISGTGTGDEEILVSDLLGCWFKNLSEAYLTGLSGYAIRMNSTVLTGTGSAAESCGWEVLSLCYPDNCFIPGLDVTDLIEDTPSYVLGLDNYGCLIKVPIAVCNPSGTGS